MTGCSKYQYRASTSSKSLGAILLVYRQNVGAEYVSGRRGLRQERGGWKPFRLLPRAVRQRISFAPHADSKKQRLVLPSTESSVRWCFIHCNIRSFTICESGQISPTFCHDGSKTTATTRKFSHWYGVDLIRPAVTPPRRYREPTLHISEKLMGHRREEIAPRR